MLLDRIIGALTFRTQVYEDVEADTSFTQAAWLIVLVAGFLSELGSRQNLLGAVVGAVIGLPIFWLTAWVIGFVGRSVFKATVTTDELVRTVGLASVWRSFGVVGAVLGGVGGLIAFIATLLWLAAALIASKASLDLEWAQTIVTVVIAFIIFFRVLGDRGGNSGDHPGRHRVGSRHPGRLACITDRRL